MIFGNNGQHIYPFPVVHLVACFCEELNKMDLKRRLWAPRIIDVWWTLGELGTVTLGGWEAGKPGSAMKYVTLRLSYKQVIALQLTGISYG